MNFVFCPKRGNKLKFVLLNRGCILGLFFYPKQGQGFKPSVALTSTQILVEYPPPPISTHIWPLV